MKEAAEGWREKGTGRVEDECDPARLLGCDTAHSVYQSIELHALGSAGSEVTLSVCAGADEVTMRL